MISAQNLADEQIHQIREIFKDLLYVSPYIIDKKKNSENLFVNKGHIKKITEKLGNFHDACLAINLRSSEYIDKISTRQEHNLLQEIRKQSQKQKQETRSTVKLEEYRALLN